MVPGHYITVTLISKSKKSGFYYSRLGQADWTSCHKTQALKCLCFFFHVTVSHQHWLTQHTYVSSFSLALYNSRYRATKNFSVVVFAFLKYKKTQILILDQYNLSKYKMQILNYFIDHGGGKVIQTFWFSPFLDNGSHCGSLGSQSLSRCIGLSCFFKSCHDVLPCEIF